MERIEFAELHRFGRLVRRAAHERDDAHASPDGIYQLFLNLQRSGRTSEPISYRQRETVRPGDYAHGLANDDRLRRRVGLDLECRQCKRMYCKRRVEWCRGGQRNLDHRGAHEYHGV